MTTDNRSEKTVPAIQRRTTPKGKLGQESGWTKTTDDKKVRRSYPAKENDPRKPKKKKKITQITYISELT